MLLQLAVRSNNKIEYMNIVSMNILDEIFRDVTLNENRYSITLGIYGRSNCNEFSK